MALYSFNVSIVSGGSGRGAVSASSYLSGVKMKDSQRNQTYNYAHRERVIYTNLLTPENAPAWANDRERLWNEVEKNEKAGRYARLYKVALPNELTEEQQIALADEIAKYYQEKGMCVDYAVHRDTDISKPAEKRNPHMHIMTTVRAFTEKGEWAQKFKSVTVRDKNGKAICIGKDKRGHKRYKHRKAELQDWGKKDELIRQRRMVAEKTNAALAKAGFSVRVDHRSNLNRGLVKLPTKHLGAKSAALERIGIHTERGNYNRTVTALNAKLENANARIANYDVKIERIEKDVSRKQRKQRNNEVARRRRNRRRKQETYSKQSFAAERIKMYYVHKRMVASHGVDNRSFAASQPDMFMQSKRQRASVERRRSEQDRNHGLPKLQLMKLMSWRDLSKAERRSLMRELAKHKDWTFANDQQKYDLTQRAMFVRSKSGQIHMYPLGHGTSRYKPGDSITADDMQHDCQAAYNAAGGAGGRDAGKALKSAADSISAAWDPSKTSWQHAKAAASDVKSIVTTPVTIARDILSNPLTGLLKAPLRVAAAGAKAASATINTASITGKAGSKTGKSGGQSVGGGGARVRGTHGQKDEWDNLLTNAAKDELRNKQLYRNI